MPDLLICVTMLAKILTLGWSLLGWIDVAIVLRFKDQEFHCFQMWGVVLATPLFLALMGWLD